MPAEDKAPNKQNHTRVSRYSMIALWTAVLAALAGQGIPAIIGLFQNKPTNEQVQEMIGKQTTILTEEFNKLLDATQQLGDKFSDLRADLEHQKGRAELHELLVKACCSHSAPPGYTPLAMAPPAPPASAPDKPAPPKLTPPDELFNLKRVPDFSLQQKIMDKKEEGKQ